MNMVSIIERVYDKINKENVIEMLKEKKLGWALPKKSTKKHELKDDFMSLVEIIEPSEIEDFIEMAVMAGSVGLPAYTYKVNSLNFLKEENNGDETVLLSDIKNRPFQDKFTITVESIEETEHLLDLTIRLKEYSEIWRSGVRNLDSLTAVYKVNISLDKVKSVVTIFSGNHLVQSTLKDFFSFVLKWPIQNYRIRENINQSTQVKSASYKTAVLIDLISNRLTQRCVFSKFKEIKFNTKNKRHTREGIKNITINGKNLLSSHLACEYITLGSDILSFKVEMSYNEVDFTSLFFLKGDDLDILKIVVTGQEDIVFKQTVIDILQEEYIDMCLHGIKDLVETNKTLEQIINKFINGDELINEVIQNSTIKIINKFAENLDKFNDQDENILDLLTEFYLQNKSILETIGYDEENESIRKLQEFVGYEEIAVIDEQDELIENSENEGIASEDSEI
ncbi:hypothetical protein [Bacillus sp. JJ1474]|uniref:hypothetical protein n=1 Tax=Bacillus sp. JJ1474 TaxID=3122955 RepID=UPI003000C907